MPNSSHGKALAVLVTRPEPGLHETMRAVAGLGFKPLACPMLRITSRQPRLPLPEAIDAIVLTSGQAVGPLARASSSETAWFGTPLLAVGDRTAERARDAGFRRVRSAQGDAFALASLVDAEFGPGAAILLASGARQGLALARSLRAAGRIVHRRVLYEAAPVPAMPREAGLALAAGAVCAGLFFSGETAASFVANCSAGLRPRLSTVDALVIGQAAANLLGALPWRAVHIAAHPQADALLDLLQHVVPTDRIQQ
nr:uroporphyrinogen-III synthase [uncultured Lichenicoccus sp.]